MCVRDWSADVCSSDLVSVPVDTLDTFADEGGQAIETSFTTTQKPLIIKSVKITKY